MTLSEKKRVFIAIVLSRRAADEAGRLGRAIAKVPGRIKPVKRANIHITVQFLGHIGVPALDRAIDLAEKFCSKIAPFRIELSGIGVFPSFRAPRVVWIGLGRGKEKAADLIRGVSGSLSEEPRGKTQKKAVPHATIARIKSVDPRIRKILKQRCSSLTVHNSETYVKDISFFESKLTSTGPVYSVIKNISLNLKII